MKKPIDSPPADLPENADDLVKFTELRGTAEEPVAPEVQGDLAELASWDEPVAERGHKVIELSEDDPSVGEDLVLQGSDEADSEVRKAAEESSEKE